MKHDWRIIDMKIDRNTTLMILRDGDRILFGLKKRGFGKGKLVGVGGKVDANETVEEAAIRETEEEIGVKVTKMQKMGELIFDNLLYRDKLECHKMHIFVGTEWEGEPSSSDEINPVWYDVHEIPYDKLWEDDQYWMPYVLIGEFVQGYFHFDGNNKIDSHWVEAVNDFVIDELADEHFGLPEVGDYSDFDERLAARAVLIDDDNRVALINSTNRGYYKLPGGGVDPGELIREALEREVAEEAGYTVDVLKSLGKTVEHRGKFKQNNVSYLYLCRAKDFIGNSLMEDEIEDGFELEWFDNIDDAIATLEVLDTTNMIYQAKFFTERELSMLKAARPIIRSMDAQTSY